MNRFSLFGLKSTAKGWVAGLAQRSLAALAAKFATGGDLDEPGRSLVAPYRQSAWVHAAIQKVTQPLTAVELYLEQDDVELDDTVLEEFWRAPGVNEDGTRMAQADFVEALGSWLLLRGEYFLLLDDTYRVPFPEVGQRSPLFILRPDNLRHVIRDGQLQAWELTGANGRRTLIDPQAIVHVKLFNPYDKWRGLSPLEAAMIAAGADYASAVYAKNAAEANGDQGVVVVAKGGMPTDVQREQITASLKEKARLQRAGIFRPIFLTGDVEVQDPKVRAMDTAFIAQRLENRKEIAAAFGVPPSFFDPQASYSIGSASDRFILIEETCKPLARKLAGGLSRVAQLQTGQPIHVCFDWDDHTTMQAVRRERIDTGLKLWGTGMPLSLVSDYLDLDLPEFPGWDQGYLPFSVAPTDAAAAPEKDPALAELPNDSSEPADVVQEMRRLFAARQQAAAPRTSPTQLETPHVCSCELPTDAEIAQRSDAGLWRKIVTARRATQKAYQSKFTRALMAARAEVLAKLEHYTPEQKSLTTRANPFEFLFKLEQFTTLVQSGFKTVSRDALQQAGQQVYDELKIENPWQTPDANVTAFLDSRANKISGASEQVFERIRRELTDGIEAGDSRDELAARVKAAFNDLDDKRARMIAQTETAAAHGYGRHVAIKATRIERKKWVTSNNQNVRTAHRYMNGYVTGVDSPFPVTNPKTGETDLVQHPGDPNGAAWNVINCHCVEIATEDPLTENADQAEQPAT